MTNEIIEDTNEMMLMSIEHLEKELATVRAGKASPAMFNGLYIEAYGAKMPINQVANISNMDARTLQIQPWDKSNVPPIEKAIFAANLGVTPQNKGDIIMVTIPPLTQERRRNLAKQVKALGEQAKVSLRSARQDAMHMIKDLVKEGLSEDLGKNAESKIEDLTKSFGKKVDQLVAAKEKEITSI